MKVKKILSFFVSAVMSLSIFSSFSASAKTPVPRVPKVYTLSELLEMSDEEFLSLEHYFKNGAEGCYQAIYNRVRPEQFPDSEGYNKIDGVFVWSVYTPPELLEDPDYANDPKYEANITEKEVSELLDGSPIEYYQISPIDSSSEKYYCWSYYIYFPQYGTNMDTWIDATDENIMEIAKIYYCLQQLHNFTYLPANMNPASVEEETVIGDINLDKTVDLYDVIWIASDLVDIFKLTEGQQKIGDVNEDSVCDLYDAIEIAKTLI